MEEFHQKEYEFSEEEEADIVDDPRDMRQAINLQLRSDKPAVARIDSIFLTE